MPLLSLTFSQPLSLQRPETLENFATQGCSLRPAFDRETGVTRHELMVHCHPTQLHSALPHKYHCGKKIALRGGGGGDTEAHFPNPPPSFAAVTGGGVQGGGARPAVPGGGRCQPNIYGSKCPRHADHFDYSNVGGGGYLVEKTFSGQNLCSCAFGANIRSYTKQRAQHGTPFLPPPPPPSVGVHVTPPPQSNFQVAHWLRFCPSNT